jgi:ribA/ribD-fused uncharacterized protein
MITSFQGPYRFLSNFWPAVVRYEGSVYPSVEHAYQAAKTLDLSAREAIRVRTSPGEAKRMGKSLVLREDWEQIRLEIMEDLVRQKFRNSKDLTTLLLATADRPLQEGNTWGDRFWGMVNGQGQNHLGKIIMKIREELRQEIIK